MYSTTEPSLRNDEKGIYFVLVAIALVTILTMVGLGIDGSRLYINSLRQQRAADAASLAGAYQIGGGTTPAEIRQIAQDVARDNFNQMGIDYDPANLGTHFQVSYDPVGTNEVDVTTNAQNESFIMGKVVQGAEFVDVAATASATKVPLAVTLVLDITGSMGNTVQDSNGNSVTKLQLLQQAARNFVAAFDPTRDRVAVLAYSFATVSERQNGANPFQVLYTLTPDQNVDFVDPNDTRNYDPTVIENRINALTASGWTSIHGGLLLALRETLRVRLLPNEPNRKEVIVLVTDGAPNRDQRPDGNTSGDGGLPEDLDVLPAGWPTLPPGSIGSGPGGKFPQLVHPDYPAGCPQDTSTDAFRDAYVESILAADLIRQAGITLMTMAIGDLDPNEDPNSPNQSPWGTLGDHGSVKGTLMRRIANDSTNAQAAGDLDFPSACASNYGQINDMPAGIGLVSNDPADFDAFLQQISNTILLRLTA